MTKASTSNEEDICDLDCNWDWGFYWDWCSNVVDKDLASIAGYSSHIDQLLLSSNGLNDVEENEENLNTRSKNSEKNNSCYEACIDELHLSCQGSVKLSRKYKEI